MKGDIPAAALRLMSSCRVSVHERVMQPYAERLSSNNVRPVRIGHITYESLVEASRQLRKSRETIRRMIERGEAHYAGCVRRAHGATPQVLQAG